MQLLVGVEDQHRHHHGAPDEPAVQPEGIRPQGLVPIDPPGTFAQLGDEVPGLATHDGRLRRADGRDDDGGHGIRERVDEYRDRRGEEAHERARGDRPDRADHLPHLFETGEGVGEGALGHEPRDIGLVCRDRHARDRAEHEDQPGDDGDGEPAGEGQQADRPEDRHPQQVGGHEQGFAADPFGDHAGEQPEHQVGSPLGGTDQADRLLVGLEGVDEKELDRQGRDDRPDRRDRVGGEHPPVASPEPSGSRARLAGRRRHGCWSKTWRRTQACMAIAAAAPALIERVEPNWSMCRTTRHTCCISGVSPGPSWPKTRTHSRGRS